MCEQGTYWLLTKVRHRAASLPRRSVSLRAVHHVYRDKDEDGSEDREEIPP